MRHRIATLAAAIILLLVASSTISNNPAVDAQSTHPPATADVQIRDGTLPGQSVVSWAIVPYATHYRIGYINMDDYAALVRSSPTASWRQTITFGELDARDIIRSGGRMEFTVQHLEPGVNYAFTVLTSNDAHWDADTVSGAFIWPKDPTWTTHVPPVNTRADDNTPVTPTPQPTPVPTATPQPTPSTGSGSPFSFLPSTSTPTPKPPSQQVVNSHLYDPVRQRMLELINEARAAANASPVTLGNNPAAQLHADDMLKLRFLSHWGSDGLKPTMRYSLTGGQQRNSENVGLSLSCFSPITTAEQIATRMMRGFMASPPHRDNILRPNHSKVNIGIAVGKHACHAVQQFEDAFVHFTQPPAIMGTRLTFAGTAHIPPPANRPIRLRAKIFHHPPTHALTRRQLANSATSGPGTPAAIIQISSDNALNGRNEVTRGTQTLVKFPNPYDTPAEPPLQDDTEMLRIHDAASRTSENPPTEIVNVIYIRTTHQDIEGTDFEVSIDIAPILQQFGDGVYTIHLSASTYTTIDKISAYSVFYGVTPPDKYANAAVR